MKHSPKDPEVRGLRALALVGQLGLVMALCIAGGVAAGVFIDRRLGGTGAFIVAGVLVGIGSGAYSAYRLLKRELRDNP